MASSASFGIKQNAQDLVVIKCDTCNEGNEKDAVHYCGNCNKNLCVSCETIHRKLLKDHKLITPFDGRRIKRLNLIVKCSSHNKKFSYYCENCNENICYKCQVEQHNGHKIINVDKHANILKTDLKGKIDNLEKYLPSFETKSKQVKDHLSYFDTFINEQISLVETETVKLRTALEAQSAKIIQDLKKEKETAQAMLKDQIKTIEDLKRDVEIMTTSIKARKDIAPDAGMLQIFNDAETKLELKSTKITLTLPNPSTFTPAPLGNQLLVGTTNNTGNTYLTIEMQGGAPDNPATSTERSQTPVDPVPSLRRDLSVLCELSLGYYDRVVSCTTDGSSCWIGLYTYYNSGKIQLVNKQGMELPAVELQHRVEHTALTTTGDLLVSGYNTTKITRVTRQGETRAFVDIAARGVDCVRGLCTTQQDDVFVCVRMADDDKDNVIKMSAQGEQILQVCQHLFTSNKLNGIHKISRDTFCVEEVCLSLLGSGSRLVIIDAEGQFLRFISKPGEPRTRIQGITGDRHGHIIIGTDTLSDDGYIHVCSGEGVCIQTFKRPRGSGGIRSLSVGEDDVMWVGTSDRGLIAAKYLE